LELVRRGFAWNYVEYSKNREVAQAETQAREQRAGLWRDWRPMAPWDWRALQKRNAAEKKLAARTVTPSSNTPSATQNEEPATLHWLNTSSNKPHNRTCRYFGNTKRGKYCEASEGSACGICGGRPIGCECADEHMFHRADSSRPLYGLQPLGDRWDHSIYRSK
jgi:hypothetical protein